MNVKVIIPMQAVVEWTSSRGLTGAVIREGERRDVQYVVSPTAEDDDQLSGSLDDILLQAERLVEKKKVGEAFLPHITNLCDQLYRQPIPQVEVSKTDLDLEAQRISDSRRAWLIREIEGGSYAAIQMLKDEFGDTVKISVEVVG